VPTEGTVGTTIQVAGSGWLPNDRVTIVLTPPRAQPAQQQRLPMARVRVDRAGRFQATLTVPADDRLIREPELWVVATGSRGARAIALFAMRPPDSESAPILPITPLPPPVPGTPAPGSDG
jgi:hypothetical protein